MRLFVITLGAFIAMAFPSQGYIEVPHSLGKCVNDSTNIVLMEVTRVNAEKNLIIFKKVTDIKGKHPMNEIKHNIGKKGFHEREWKNIMAWAEPGKKAVFMYNNEASETCIHTYWYQAYREGDWWGMSHAEPFLLRTFYGDPEKLAELITKMLNKEEVLVPCLADQNKEQFHLRKGKIQRLKASLKKNDYNAKRDFAGWGGDGDEIDEFKTTNLIAESAEGWKYLSVKALDKNAKTWMGSDFDDAKWSQGKAPIGYGEEEIAKRKGTTKVDKGTHYVFRKAVDVPAELIEKKGVQFRISIASDDSADIYLNGQLIDKDPEADHEFQYWNRDVDVALKNIKPGKNVVAVYVRNTAQSSDLYFDLEFIAQVPIPKPPKKKDPGTVVKADPKDTPVPKQSLVPDEPRDPKAMIVDEANKTITINGVIAPRKLPQFDQVYPIEVIVTYAAPKGQKAHETVFNFKGVRPSDLHLALEKLKLKAGKPAYGEGTKATGPEVTVMVEFPGPDGKPKRLPIEECLVHKDGGKQLPVLKWYFTGSVKKNPDPEKDEEIYGADMTGTFLSIFPVTDCCVLQTQLTMKDEPNYKLDVNAKVLPKEGTAIKLIVQIP